MSGKRLKGLLCILTNALLLVSFLVPPIQGNPQLEGNYSCPDFYLEHGLLYTLFKSRLLVLNNTDPNQLVFVGEQDSSIASQTSREIIWKYNDYLLLLRREVHYGQTPEDIDYFEVIDVSNPTEPVLMSEMRFPSSYSFSYKDIHSRGIVTKENELYLILHCNDETDLLCINCTTLSQPAFVDGYTNFPTEADEAYTTFQRFVIRDNLLFIPTKNASLVLGFAVYNFTSIDTVTKVGDWFGATNLTKVDFVELSKDFLCLKEESPTDVITGIDLFNISNLVEPTRLGSMKHFSMGLFLTYPYLITHNYSNLLITDISNIEYPIVTDMFDYCETFTDRKIDFYVFDSNKITETSIYLPEFYTNLNETLHILDWSDPSNITITAILGFGEFLYTNSSPMLPVTVNLLLICILVFFVKLKLEVKFKRK